LSFCLEIARANRVTRTPKTRHLQRTARVMCPTPALTPIRPVVIKSCGRRPVIDAIFRTNRALSPLAVICMAPMLGDSAITSNVRLVVNHGIPVIFGHFRETSLRATCRIVDEWMSSNGRPAASAISANPPVTLSLARNVHFARLTPCHPRFSTLAANGSSDPSAAPARTTWRLPHQEHAVKIATQHLPR